MEERAGPSSVAVLRRVEERRSVYLPLSSILSPLVPLSYFMSGSRGEEEESKLNSMIRRLEYEEASESVDRIAFPRPQLPPFFNDFA